MLLLFFISGEDDHVFVNFADHGGYGLLGFPSSEVKFFVFDFCCITVYWGTLA